MYIHKPVFVCLFVCVYMHVFVCIFMHVYVWLVVCVLETLMLLCAYTYMDMVVCARVSVL